MLRPTVFSLVAGLLLASGPAAAQDPAPRWPAAWSRPAQPFRIIGNIHFVGTEGIGAFLITSPQGHILLDGAMPDSAPLIARNVERLGFRLRDVKYLINSHAHLDHAGGLADLKRLTGAKLAASAGDRPALEAGAVDYGATKGLSFPAVKVDRVIADGGTLTVGAVVLKAHVTPGHSKGCTSWTTTVRDGNVTRPVIFYCSTTVAGQDLHRDADYPGAAADFRRSFARLRRLKADVFLAGHAEFYDLWAKKRRLDAGDLQAFVDPAELGRHVDASAAAFEAEFQKSSAPAGGRLGNRR